MSITKTKWSSILFSYLMVFALTVSADPFTLSINPASVQMSNAEYKPGLAQHAGLVMPDVDLSNFSFGFSVPFGYVTGDPIYIGITWHTDATTPCTIELRPDFVSIAQRGKKHIQGATASTGLSAVSDGNILQAVETDRSEMKIYVLNSPDGETKIQELDAINIGFFRRPTFDNDTCAGNLKIQGIAAAAL